MPVRDPCCSRISQPSECARSSPAWKNWLQPCSMTWPGRDRRRTCTMRRRDTAPGHETTVVAIGVGVLCLLANPAQRRALADDPGLATPAVEEILRAPGRRGGGIPRLHRTH